MAIEAGDDFELEGFWEIPSSSGTTEVHGHLVYSPDEGATLRTAARSTPHDVLGDTPDPAMIHGWTVDGVPCSLVRPIPVNTRSRLFAGPTFVAHEWHSTCFVHGGKIESLSALVVRRLVVSWRGLTEWLHGSGGISPTSDPVVVELGDGSLTLKLEKNERSSALETHERWVGVAELAFNTPRRWSEVQLSLIQPLRHLVLFGTGAPAPLQSLTLLDVGMADQGIAEGQARDRVELVFQDIARPLPSSRLDPYARQLMPFSVWRQEPGALFSQWLSLHERLGAAGALIFSSLERKAPFVENRFFNLVSFAEAYHRIVCPLTAVEGEEHGLAVDSMVGALSSDVLKNHYRPRLQFANEFGLRARLKALFRRAEALLPLIAEWRRDQLPDDLVSARNSIAHEAGANKPLDGWNLHLATERLRIVLEANLMLDIGLDQLVITKLLERRYSSAVGVLSERSAREVVE